MGTNSVYLIPRSSKILAAEWEAKARAVLVEMEVIGFWEGAGPGVFGNGARSADAFEMDEDEEDVPFDSGIIQALRWATLLPEMYSETAHCPACGMDVDGKRYDTVWDEHGKHRGTDMREARIACPRCGRESRLDELKDDFGTKFYLSDRFVEFTDSLMPKEEWLKEFNKRMGVEHDVLAYGYT